MPITTGPTRDLVQYMNYLQKGLAVHTDNLSRADLPGAEAREMKPFAAQVHHKSSAHIKTTNHMHMTGKNSSSGGFATQKAKADFETLSGNNINTQQELSKINDIGTEALKATRLYQKTIGLMRTALGVKG